MNCRKYRACLAGVVALALLCGILFVAKYEKENRVPSGGVLVQEKTWDEAETWA